MKKLLAIFLAAIAAATCAFTLTGCGADRDGLQYVDGRTKTITVGITNAAPMNYKNSDGKWIGFDTDLAVTVFNALGYKVLFKEIAWGNKYIELEAGTIDCIWNGFTANSSDKVIVDGQESSKERNELVLFSKYYMINEQCVVRNKNVTFVDQNSFDGKTIAYEVGSSGDAGIGWLEEDFSGVNFIRKGCVAQSNALQEVDSGTADFAIVDLSIAENAKSLQNIEIVPNTVFDFFTLEYYAIGFELDDAEATKLCEQVNTLLDALKEVGYLKELCEKYSIEYSRVEQAFSYQPE